VAGSLKGKVAETDHAQAVAIDSSGRIVVAGYAYNGSYNVFAVARYNSDGSLDTTFNNKGSLPGSVETTLVANKDNKATAIVIQSDGKILVGGTANGQFGLVRYNSNGTLDTTFGSAGIEVVAYMGSPGGDGLNGLALDSSGNIVAVGQGPSPSNGWIPKQFLVARLTSSGEFDSSFGSGNGYVFTDVGQGTLASMAQAVQIESNGHIAVGGRTNADGFGLARYNSDGTLDTGFNGTGTLRYYTPNYTFNAGYALGIASGNYVVAGDINGDFGVIRVDPPVGGVPTATGAAAATLLDVSPVSQAAHLGMRESLAIALPPGAGILPIASTVCFQPTPSAFSSSAPPAQAVGETRVGPRVETHSGGGDEEATDQAFVDWQSDGWTRENAV
jgi:uncharacterized delta-60 repeat protein